MENDNEEKIIEEATKKTLNVALVRMKKFTNKPGQLFSSKQLAKVKTTYLIIGCP